MQDQEQLSTHQGYICLACFDFFFQYVGKTMPNVHIPMKVF